MNVELRRFAGGSKYRCPNGSIDSGPIGPCIFGILVAVSLGASQGGDADICLRIEGCGRMRTQRRGQTYRVYVTVPRHSKKMAIDEVIGPPPLLIGGNFLRKCNAEIE